MKAFFSVLVFIKCRAVETTQTVLIFREMALNEVNVLATLDHPNIIGYHDSFEKDGVLMIEMEYADGGNLAEFLSKQKT